MLALVFAVDFAKGFVHLFVGQSCLSFGRALSHFDTGSDKVAGYFRDHHKANNAAHNQPSGDNEKCEKRCTGDIAFGNGEVNKGAVIRVDKIV